MSARETLEQFLSDNIWIPNKLGPAIREVLEENERLKAERMPKSQHNALMLASAEAALTIQEDLEAKIEAALEELLAVTCHVTAEEKIALAVKALRGEAVAQGWEEPMAKALRGEEGK